jgi:excisionase family DNA binding protein
MGEYLTVQEAAELMGVSRFTVWRRIRAGELPVYQSGVDRRARLVKRTDVEALMRPHAVEDVEKKAAA